MAKLYRLQNEDRNWKSDIDRMSSDDPELDTATLAEIAGCSERYMRRLLAQSRIGRLVHIAASKDAPERVKRVVRWSELRALRDDVELHRALFG
jgi:hypothetical protein